MQVARLAGVGKGRGESAPPAAINVDSEQLVSSTSTGNGSKGPPLLYNSNLPITGVPTAVIISIDGDVC